MLPILFDFDLFSSIVGEVYQTVETDYSLEDAISIFRYFFQAYEANMGEQHPGIKREQIRYILQKISYLVDNTGLQGSFCIDLEPEYYPPMIDNYFITDFPRCNHRINHFFSGNIRLLRYYEVFV